MRIIEMEAKLTRLIQAERARDPSFQSDEEVLLLAMERLSEERDAVSLRALAMQLVQSDAPDEEVVWTDLSTEEQQKRIAEGWNDLQAFYDSLPKRDRK